MADNRETIKKLLGATNKAISDGGEKDKCRREMHQALVESGMRAEMEAKVRELIEQAGCIDNIDVDQIIATTRECFTPAQQARLDEIKKQTAQRMANFLSEQGDQR